MTDWRSITVELDTTTRPSRPVAFHWDGVRLPIAAFGRRWQAIDGLHRIIRTQDGRVFELWEAGSGWQGRLRTQPPGVV